MDAQQLETIRDSPDFICLAAGRTHACVDDIGILRFSTSSQEGTTKSAKGSTSFLLSCSAATRQQCCVAIECLDGTNVLAIVIGRKAW